MQFLYYIRINKRIKTVVSVLSYGVLERSSSPYVESIVELYVSLVFLRIRKRSLLCGFEGKKILKKGWGSGKKYPWTESGIVYLLVREKKITALKLLYRSSHLQLPEACNFIKNETLTEMFSCKFCEISKNTLLHRTPTVAASNCSHFRVYRKWKSVQRGF